MTTTEKTQNGTTDEAAVEAALFGKPAAAAEAAAAVPSIAVGEKLKLNPEDNATLTAVQLKLQNLQQTYAERAESFRREEAVLFQAIEKVRSDRQTTINILGNKYGLMIDTSAAEYAVDFSTMTYTRTK